MNTENLPEEELADDQVIGLAFRWSLAVFAVIALVAIGAILYWKRPQPQPLTTSADSPVAQVREVLEIEIPRVQFVDVTKQAGIDFVHVNGAYGAKLLPETMGGGCAFLDFDNDGDQDILLINSTYWDDRAPDNASQPTMKLYRNRGNGNFDDVTVESGMGLSFYGMGVAVGDYDNDSWVDVYITAVGKNRLLKNYKGVFQEVTDHAGVSGASDSWSTSCCWFDFENDGDLDLFVCNYVQWAPEFDLAQDFRLDGGGRAYGPPTAFSGTYPYLFINEGNGTFVDWSKDAGVRIDNRLLQVPLAKSLGVAPIDLNQDGWMDLVVANDTVQNLLFINQQGKSFEERGKESGIAFDSGGNTRGAMGIHAARYRNDNAIGIAIGNFSNEMTALYVSLDDSLQFTDDAIASGLGPVTRLELTFGLFFFDYDLDGRLDLLTANGHLEEDIAKVQRSQRYEQPPHLFWNCGPNARDEFNEVTEEHCGKDICAPLVGRGATYADIDGDGDLDVLITATGGAPRLLRNDQDLDHHWIRFKLVGSSANRDAIGSWIELKLGEATIQRQVMPTVSYLSQTELPVTIGLGKNPAIDSVEIRWPDGTRQQVAEFKLDQLNIIEQNSH